MYFPTTFYLFHKANPIRFYIMLKVRIKFLKFQNTRWNSKYLTKWFYYKKIDGIISSYDKQATLRGYSISINANCQRQCVILFTSKLTKIIILA